MTLFFIKINYYLCIPKKIKNMKKILFVLFMLFAFYTNAQEFKPFGTPEALVFTNFNSSTTNSQTLNKFEITRAYFGYDYNFSKTFTGRVVFDFVTPGNVFIKYGYMQYEKNGLNVRFGLTPNVQIDRMEKFWNHRYIMKSFQDKYSMSPSSDYGVDVYYKFNKLISADIAILNGEGYKSAQLDSVFKVIVGVTLHPTKELVFHTYYDNMTKNIAQQTISLMTGYSNEKFNIGVEYSKQINSKYKKGYNYSGYSICGTYNLNSKFSLIGRYDIVNSESTTITPWNFSNDGQQYVLGLEFKPVKGIKIAPNSQLWSGRNNKNVLLFGLNLELRM